MQQFLVSALKQLPISILQGWFVSRLVRLVIVHYEEDASDSTLAQHVSLLHTQC